jgi:probable rRNA maturation factor
VSHLKEVLKLIFALEKRGGETSVLFVDDHEISELNKIYRKKNGPTDVLSFPCDFQHSAVSVLGDIVISVPMAARQADSKGHPLVHEIVFLLIHGILHLLGYDHHRSSDRKKMFSKQDFYFQECFKDKNSPFFLFPRKLSQAGHRASRGCKRLS